MYETQAIVAVALGGALGSVLRFVVGAAIVQRMGPGFPWATLVINLSGSFVIGLVAELTQTRAVASGAFVRLFLMVGVLGGYTTFSTFAFEGAGLLREGAAVAAVTYLFGSVVCGVAGAFGGAAIVRALG